MSLQIPGHIDTRAFTMKKKAYIEMSLRSAQRYVDRGTDALGREILSPKRYLEATKTRATIRWNQARIFQSEN